MAKTGELRFIPRAEFVANHFPQAKCERCQFRMVCRDLLSVARSHMRDDFWLVRGESECARDSAPSDVRLLQRREMARLSEIQEFAEESPSEFFRLQRRLASARSPVAEKTAMAATVGHSVDPVLES